MQRIKHCRDRLNAYIAGDLDTISELNEPLLDAFGNGTEFERKARVHMSWATSAVVDVI